MSNYAIFASVDISKADIYVTPITSNVWHSSINKHLKEHGINSLRYLTIINKISKNAFLHHISANSHFWIWCDNVLYNPKCLGCIDVLLALRSVPFFGFSSWWEGNQSGLKRDLFQVTFKLEWEVGIWTNFLFFTANFFECRKLTTLFSFLLLCGFILICMCSGCADSQLHEFSQCFLQF